MGCLVALAFLLSCGGGRERFAIPVGEAHQALSEIDSLMWRQPGNAFLRLQEFASSPLADSLDAFDQHYCQLLISELLYKNYYSQSNREELLLAVDYLDSVVECGMRNRSEFRIISFLDARAHYIKGVGYYEMDSMVEACGEYLKSLEVMEEHFEEKEFVGKKAQFLSLTHNRLGELFSGQFMMEPSIVCFEQALIYNQISPISTYGTTNILSRIGQQYDMLGEKEKAHDYYEKAFVHLPDNDNLPYRDLLSFKAMNEYQLGMSMEQSMGYLRIALSHARDEDEKLTRYLTMGSMFYEEGMFDSALCYLQPVFEANKDLVSSIQAAEYLKNIHQNKGDKEKAQQYASFLSEHTVESYDNMALVTRLNELFNKHVSEQQLRETTKDKKRTVAKTVRTLVFVALLVVTPLVCLIIWNKKRRKTLQEETAQWKENETKARQTLESERRIHEETMERERHAHKTSRDALSGRLKERNKEVSRLKKELDQLKKQQDDEAVPNFVDNPDERFLDEPICKQILDRVEKGRFKSKISYKEYKAYALKKQELQALRRAVNHHYGKFTVRLKSRYPRLSDTDLDYCCLYLLGLTEADLAALLQRSYNTVIERSGKLRSVLGGQGPVPDILRSILYGC